MEIISQNGNAPGEIIGAKKRINKLRKGMIRKLRLNKISQKEKTSVEYISRKKYHKE